MKNGFKYHKQRYLCKTCGKQFIFRQKIDNQELYNDYVFGKQTLKQLSIKYKITVRTVQRKLSIIGSIRVISSNKKVIVLMDTTYWGKDFGVVVFKDFRTKKILWRKYIFRKETLSDYQEGMDCLLVNGFKIDAIVCDGLRGMFQLFYQYRVQMCQFHQISIVKCYLTQRPELENFIELLNIVKQLCHTDKERFVALFEQWIDKWSFFSKNAVWRQKRAKQGTFTNDFAALI